MTPAIRGDKGCDSESSSLALMFRESKALCLSQEPTSFQLENTSVLERMSLKHTGQPTKGQPSKGQPTKGQHIVTPKHKGEMKEEKVSVLMSS